MARRTAEQALATRERIVLSAAAVFAEHGFSRPSLAHIAADAGVTRGAVYAHFDGKRDLFNSVCDLINWPLLNEQDSVSHASGGNPLDDLKRAVHVWMQDIDGNPLRRCVLDIVLHKTEWTEENAELLDRLHRSNNEVTQRIRCLLEDATAMGALSLPMSTQVASSTLQAALLGVVSACLRTSTTATLPSCGDWLVVSLLQSPRANPMPPSP